jgi:RimJ/RimL family protein N-acetyltransferase
VTFPHADPDDRHRSKPQWSSLRYLLSYPDPPLTDGVLVLRRWTESDIGCVEEGSRDPDIPSGTTVPARFTPADGLAWIERQWGRADKREGLSLAIADAGSGEAVGNINLLLRRRPLTAEIGYWLIPRVRGRGLGSRAVALFARWAVTGAGLARVEALVVPDNMVSQRVLEKAGFRREGHLRSYLVFDEQRADALIYSLLPTDVA